LKKTTTLLQEAFYFLILNELSTAISLSYFMCDLFKNLTMYLCNILFLLDKQHNLLKNQLQSIFVFFSIHNYDYFKINSM